MALLSKKFSLLKLEHAIRFLRLCSTVTSQEEKAKSSVDDIVIPYRIERGPTDILKALASTVGTDYTAPLYKYHDDPFLIPASNVAKRTYALAKESGRKSAQYFLEKFPEHFENNPADPVIKAFMPPTIITEDSDVTEETLIKCIELSQVENSKTAYNNLSKKGTEISKETQQRLLELLCFYNAEEPTPEEYTEERWHRQIAIRDGRKLWSKNSLANHIFENMKEKDSLAYCAMIQGLAKYLQVNRAFGLYQEMQEKGLPANVETYNSLISIAPFLRESSESRWILVKELLHCMNTECLLPNIRTLNAVLDIISRFGSWKAAKPLALSTLAEMKKLGIEPSLGSWYYILIIFCKERGPPSHVLYEIMEDVQGKEFQIRHPKDVFFFVTAMDVCHNHLMDRDLAYRIHQLFLHGQNSLLIGDSYKQSIYYQHFFKLLCATEDIDIFFEHYNKHVPNLYIPEPGVMEKIIEAVKFSGELSYIPKLWSDIIIFLQTERERVIQLLLSAMASGTKDELAKRFADIAWEVKDKIDKAAEGRFIRPIQWSGQMIDDIIIICLNAGEKEKAWEMIKKLDEAGEIMGMPRIECLKKFCISCLEEKQVNRVIYCLQYALEVGYEELGVFVQKQADAFNVSEKDKKDIENIISLKSTLNHEEHNDEDQRNSNKT